MALGPPQKGVSAHFSGIRLSLRFLARPPRLLFTHVRRWGSAKGKQGKTIGGIPRNNILDSPIGATISGGI